MSRRFCVVVTGFIADDLFPERSVLGDVADVTALDAYTQADLPGRIDDADAAMLYHTDAAAKTPRD